VSSRNLLSDGRQRERGGNWKDSEYWTSRARWKSGSEFNEFSLTIFNGKKFNEQLKLVGPNWLLRHRLNAKMPQLETVLQGQDGKRATKPHNIRFILVSTSNYIVSKISPLFFFKACNTHIGLRPKVKMVESDVTTPGSNVTLPVIWPKSSFTIRVHYVSFRIKVTSRGFTRPPFHATSLK